MSPKINPKEPRLNIPIPRSPLARADEVIE